MQFFRFAFYPNTILGLLPHCNSWSFTPCVASTFITLLYLFFSLLHRLNFYCFSLIRLLPVFIGSFFTPCHCMVFYCFCCLNFTHLHCLVFYPLSIDWTLPLAIAWSFSPLEYLVLNHFALFGLLALFIAWSIAHYHFFVFYSLCCMDFYPFVFIGLKSFCIVCFLPHSIA